MANDPYFSNVSLLLRGDIINGFTDLSGKSHTITLAGDTAISAATPKFGIGVMTFDGVGDYLHTEASSDFAFSTGDHTLEGWFYVTGEWNDTYSTIFCTAFTHGHILRRIYGGALECFDMNSYAHTSATGVLPLNSWCHVADVVLSGTRTIYVNGTSVLSYASSYDLTDNQFFVADIQAGQTNDRYRKLHGYAQDIRVTKGIARYTANFSVPADFFYSPYAKDFFLLSESVGFSAALSPAFGFTQKESALFEVVGRLFDWTVNATLRETVVFSESLAVLVKVLISNVLALADGLTGSTLRVLLLAETLAVATRTINAIEALCRLAEALITADATTLTRRLSAQEGVQFAANITNTIEALFTSQETLALADRIKQSFILIAKDGVEVTTGLASALAVTLRAKDGIAFVGSLSLAGGTYSAWVMNAETLGMTTYTNYPFESMAELNGRLFGVRADGLFELTGQTDNGTKIDAVLRTGVLELWGGAEGSLPDAWLYVLANNTILLTVTTDRYGSRIMDTYEVVPRVNEGTDTENLRWVELFQDTVGTHVQFEIRNVDGGDFTFKGAQIYPVALSTRGH